jgi:hypothetical protein
MKKTSWIFIGLALAAILYIALFAQKPKVVALDQKNAAVTNPVISIAATNASTSQIPTSKQTDSDSKMADIANRYNKGAINKGEAMQEVFMEENKKPLDIYGKVIDQYGQPVFNAKIEGGILLNVNFIKSKGETHYTETDINGLFSFIGIHGKKLGIWPKKEGYIYDLRLPSQRPENYQPDPNSPIVFTMWKLRGPEPLVSSGIDAHIPHDGTPVVFDLTSGKQSPNGDFRVALSQYPLEVQKGWDKFDWSVKVEILNGGLVEENDAYPFWAPADGYQPSFEFNESTNAVKWIGGLQKKFYVKTAQGQYGMMQFKVYPGRSPTGVEVNITVNPSGSQNLEPTPEK